MEAYPTELTSPPVPLVALVGKQELLRPLAEYLRIQHVPRIHSIGIEDAHSAAGTFGVRKGSAPAVPTAGILKAGWLRKHRTQRPAVAAVLVERDAVAGDPSSWAWLVSQLDAVKAAVRSRGARVVVIVAVPPGAGEVPEDRMSMLCRQAGADRRCVLTYTPSEGPPSLQALGRVLHEQAAAFYASDAQRRLAQHAHRNVPSLDLNLRTAFKLGALAEFRADWVAALRMYGEAYTYVPQLLAAAGGLTPQRFAEIRAVAEQAHVKVVSLLLLALKQLPDALAQFEAHMRLFRRVPFEAQPGLLASHHAWLCRQHTVMAELLMSCGADLAAAKPEHQPGQLYLSAAKAAIERRKVAAFISGMHGGQAPTPPGQVEPGLFVGQLLMFPADTAAAALAAGSAAVAAALAGVPVTAAAAAAGVAKRLTDEQFELALEAEECGVDHSKATVDLLRTAQNMLQRSGRRSSKTLQHAMLLLGHELLEAGDVAGAQRLLAEVAGVYRRERWEGPLATALLLLRECHQHTHDLQAHTALSLELSALCGSSLDAEQRAAMATAAVAVLVPEPQAPGTAATPAAGQGGDAAGTSGQQGQQPGALVSQRSIGGMHYSVESPDSGWLTVLPLCAGFFDPLRADTPDGGTDGTASVSFAAAVLNNTPIDLPLASAEVQLSDSLGAFSAQLAPAEAGGSAQRQTAAEAAAVDLVLPAGGWLRLAATFPVRCSGDVQASEIVLRFGDVNGGSGAGTNSITFRLPSLLPAPPQEAPVPASPRPRSAAAARRLSSQAGPAAVGWLRGGWAASQPPFSVASGFLPGRRQVELPPQHASPALVLQAPEALLQGEQAAVTVTITAAGDAIQGAVLCGRALHVETQQQLGMVQAAGGACQQTALQQQAAPTDEEGDAAGEASQLGAEAVVQLGDLSSGEQRTVVLLLDARYRGTAEVAVELQYAAAAGSGKPEAGHCTALLAVPVQLPWRLGLQLLGPHATHTLLAAPPLVSPSTASSEADGGAALLEQQRRRLQSLSVQDSPAKAAAGMGMPTMGLDLGPADGRDLSVLLLRSLPPRLVLPAGQRCMMLVQLQSLAGCQLDVLGVELEAAEGVSMVPAVPAAADSIASGRRDSSGAAFAATAECDTLNKSDIFTAAFSVSSSGTNVGTAGAADAAELPSLGFLRLRWRRHQRQPALLTAASRGASRLSAFAAKAAAAGAPGGTSPAGTAHTATAPPACEVLVPLPAAAFLQPLLTASVLYPPSAAAGQPATLELVLRNAGGTTQDVGVVVGDPHGFLLAGPKTTSVQLLPRSAGTVSWQAVPYHTGLLRLPEITISASQHGQQVEATRGCSVFVERPPEQQEAAAPPAAAPAVVNLADMPSLI